MTMPIIKTVSENNEEIERPMTPEEFSEYQKGNAELEAINAEIKSKTEAKAALFERLGITAEEATLLLS